jgi:hypothetical protein
MRYIQTLANLNAPPSVEEGPEKCETTRGIVLSGIMELMQTNHARRTETAAKERFPRVYRHKLYRVNGIEYVLENRDVRDLYAMFMRPENLRLGLPEGLSREERKQEQESFKMMLCVLAQEAGAPPPDFEALRKRSKGAE